MGQEGSSLLVHLMFGSRQRSLESLIFPLNFILNNFKLSEKLKVQRMSSPSVLCLICILVLNHLKVTHCLKKCKL